MKITKEMLRVDETRAFRVLTIVDQGLISGSGERELGQMCVEQAVSFAYGEFHTDHPTCVASELAGIKIDLNDEGWDDEQSRAAGLRRIAIAQLGSRGKFKTTTFWLHVNDYVGKFVRDHFIAEVMKCKNVREMTAATENACGVPPDFKSRSRCIEAFNAMGFSDDKSLALTAEAYVQACIKMKLPGTKYLYLTEGKLTAAQKKKKKKLLADLHREAKQFAKDVEDGKIESDGSPIKQDDD